MIELILIYLVIKTVIFDVTDFVILTPTVEVFICRFICSFLLHMELIEDVRQGLNMMDYLNTHPDEFS